MIIFRAKKMQIEQRYTIKFLCSVRTSTETLEMVKTTYPDDCFSWFRKFELYKKFKGFESVKDNKDAKIGG